MTLGLVREQEAGLQAFLSHDGFSVLMRGIQSDSEKLRTKSAFLLLNLLTSHPEQKGKCERQDGAVKLSWGFFKLYLLSISWHTAHLVILQVLQFVGAIVALQCWVTHLFNGRKGFFLLCDCFL